MECNEFSVLTKNQNMKREHKRDQNSEVMLTRIIGTKVESHCWYVSQPWCPARADAEGGFRGSVHTTTWQVVVGVRTDGVHVYALPSPENRMCLTT